MYYKVEDKNGKNVFETSVLGKAIAFFKKTKSAKLIQKYTHKGGATAGYLQPGIPNKIKIKNRVYKRPIIDFFTKTKAEKMKKDLTEKNYCIIRKYKQGYQLFYSKK